MSWSNKQIHWAWNVLLQAVCEAERCLSGFYSYMYFKYVFMWFFFFSIFTYQIAWNNAEIKEVHGSVPLWASPICIYPSRRYVCLVLSIKFKVLYNRIKESKHLIFCSHSFSPNLKTTSRKLYFIIDRIGHNNSSFTPLLQIKD